MLDLAGCWTLSAESGAQVIACDLQGDGISALVRGGVLPDFCDLMSAGLIPDALCDSAAQKFTLPANVLSLFVAVESEVPDRFPASAATAFPRHPVTFTPEDPLAVPVFTFRDLHSATYGA